MYSNIIILYVYYIRYKWYIGTLIFNGSIQALIYRNKKGEL